MAEDSRGLLVEGARTLGIELSDLGVDRLATYLAELIKWSRRVNLIAHDTPELQIIDTHFLDSLALSLLLRADDGPVHLLDVGTGAGFPGLVLACALAEARFTLVEPRQKRVSFLRHIVRTLRLENVEIVAARIEPHAAAWHGRFTHLTSRAVAEPAVFLPLIRPLITPSTGVILMLTRQEALAGLEQLPAGPWRLGASRELALPFSGAP
ncbi:MAG: 16S rRNA (guanine(527)-N(7))-methyltransferase RsmG, partial [Proteobacteria bacterium]|nr:16S rRNA (guanine(527)-N(7))-methyltransferase RsmG [Pseudomonadota bacterium]